MSSPPRRPQPFPGARRSIATRGSPSAGNTRDSAAAFHPRNRHQGRYDFPRLLAAHPPLARYMTATPAGDPTIRFADPLAVRALNRALLADYYGIRGWDIPEGFLCPPTPGRADYLHQIADLLAGDAGGRIPHGPQLQVLDVGVGANCIYPLIGHHEYGWRFVGSDVNPLALAAAECILAANPAAKAAIALRRQADPLRILHGVIDATARFDLTMCNPPFHESPSEALAGTRRKWRNLAKTPTSGRPPAGDALNFGGQAAELWCPGGELAFVRRMIDESRALAGHCLWFTTLVSKGEHLAAIERALAGAGAIETRMLKMAQGQKLSRVVAWTFHHADARQAWARRRWSCDSEAAAAAAAPSR